VAFPKGESLILVDATDRLGQGLAESRMLRKILPELASAPSNLDAEATLPPGAPPPMPPLEKLAVNGPNVAGLFFMPVP
jgi:hypothetical protein